MVTPKISLNTSNATLRTQKDWKCHSQCWHVLFLRSWLEKFCILFKYLLTEFCDSLSSWPCVNLGRLSHQKTFIKNTFHLNDIVFDIYFRDFTLPLVPSVRSADDCKQPLLKTYEHQFLFSYFCWRKVQINNKNIILTFDNTNLSLSLSVLPPIPIIILCHGPVISTTPHSVATPTVCGHAEACPSTTYANFSVARGHYRGSS